MAARMGMALDLLSLGSPVLMFEIDDSILIGETNADDWRNTRLFIRQ